jgi:chromate reductase
MAALDDIVRVLGISGSLQSGSGNRTLLDRAGEVAPAGVEFRLYEGLAELPHFNPELEAEGTLAVVDLLRDAVKGSDALLIASPEYGHSLPGSLKNAIDWLIGTGELERKIVAVTAAVPHPDRGLRGLAALIGTLNAVSAVIVGGEPIVRGDGLDDAVSALLLDLVRTVNAARAEERQ